MGNYQQFEDLRVWQEARDLYSNISSLFKECQQYFFRDQIMKATLSVSNNIAEGFERKSNKEWVYFLFIAKGSCGEVRSMLHLAQDQKLINEKQKDELISQTLKISKMLGSLISASIKNG